MRENRGLFWGNRRIYRYIVLTLWVGLIFVFSYRIIHRYEMVNLYSYTTVSENVIGIKKLKLTQWSLGTNSGLQEAVERFNKKTWINFRWN